LTKVKPVFLEAVTMVQEKEIAAKSGWPILVVNILLGLLIIVMVATPLVAFFPFLVLAFVFLLAGYFTLQPNEARLLILFGSYHGTVKQSGFFWANPFYSRGYSLQVRKGTDRAAPPAVAFQSKVKMSLRLRSLNVPQIKVNDKQGNPIEIAAVVIWAVKDTARAVFDVDDYENFVAMQSETALRHLANAYPYDHGEGEEVTLRSGVDEVSVTLKRDLQERLDRAGIVVEETRLTHLAYAPEIAGVMLRRQQAEAIIAARQKIVHGAVSMVEMALNELSEKQVLKLDEDRKAAMVSNLLVVLCAEHEAQPIVNTGTP
jgi:regulator of protease activity HflC (stomatin/prohibitin superfamily)